MNTYKDNPARGLSKLQKNILLWLWEVEMANPDIRYVGCRRPSFGYQRERGYSSNAELAAVSKSIKRLVDRGLVFRIPHFGQRLTSLGWEVANRLQV